MLTLVMVMVMVHSGSGGVSAISEENSDYRSSDYNEMNNLRMQETGQSCLKISCQPWIRIISRCQESWMLTIASHC